jgi:hypothetical protein
VEPKLTIEDDKAFNEINGQIFNGFVKRLKIISKDSNEVEELRAVALKSLLRLEITDKEFLVAVASSNP